MINTQDDSITVKQLAEKWNLKEGTIRQRIRRKQLPAHKLAGHWYFLKSELNATIRNSECSLD